MSDSVQHAVNLLQNDFIVDFPADAVPILEGMAESEIAGLLSEFSLEEVIALWELLSPDVAMRTVLLMGSEQGGAILREMDPTRTAALLSACSEHDRGRLLELLPLENRQEQEMLLSYPIDTAGSMMDPKVLLLRPETTVREALERIRAQRRRGIRILFVVDIEGRLQGAVDIQDLATANGPVTLDEIMRPVKGAVGAMASREEVVEMLDRQPLTDLAVVDLDGRLVGAVRYQKLMDAAEDEATVAIQTMVGVSKEERALSSAWFAVRKRLPWLHINLITAFIAAAVVGMFEETIASFTALAVLLPVVAGQSGNTGAQALAVTMRGLALREIRTRQWPRVVLKEMSAGFWNGIAVSFTTSLGVWLWSGSVGLAAIIAISMVLSMVIAGVSGAAIPLLLTVAKQDPAQSSSIILTTITDVAGFFSFLGIATLLLTTI
ncbi:MAG: magnesium transporter [Gammaproteobacteria bacterium]|nr:magnesium transporter [Gammaproteobacteria bacterium]